MYPMTDYPYPANVTRAVRAGTEGLEVTLTFVDDDGEPIPIASIGSVELLLKGPQQSAVPITGAAVVGDGSAGAVLMYIDIPQPGLWIVQGRLAFTMPDGKIPSAQLILTAERSLFQA